MGFFINKTPKFFLKYLSIFSIFIVLLSTIFFILFKSSSFKTPSLTNKEEKKLTNFLEYLLLREGGIYVLFGSKPIAHSNLCIVQKDAINKNMQNLSKKIKKDPKYKKIKLKFYIQDWQQVRNRFKIKKKYLLIFKKHDKSITADVFLINRKNLTFVLKQHYPIFKKKTNMNFNPSTIINEFDNPNSKFWNLVFKDWLLQGLIYGYGLESSSLFNDWITMDSQDKQKYINNGFQYSDQHIVDKQIKVNYQKFSLPIFRCLPQDKHLKKYKKERRKIQKIYKGKDPLKVTLKKLCK